ncbi:MAG TPA: hypothetical protein ENO22_11435 [candidate division Zixibacteria bacterium]|nr:hypothetical protein [candidate division Zixibacteria bacterium]HEQ99939.1 hypothetical protein [candidate division Zixibacteria bacterium]
MRKNFKTILTALVALSFLILAFIIGSCCDDCPVGPVQPKPYNGWLYAIDMQNRWVYKIDVENDSLVDSVYYETTRRSVPGTIDVSTDGRFLAVGYYDLVNGVRFTRIYDAQTLDTLTDLADYNIPVFIPDQDIMIGIGQRLRIYSLPDFTIVHEEATSLSAYPIVNIKNDLVFMNGAVNPEHVESTFIYSYDYVNREIEREWYFRDKHDSIVFVTAFDINKDGTKIYCLNYSNLDGTMVTCYDLETEEIIFSYPIFSWTGSVRLTPDEEYLYVTEPGDLAYYGNPGTVYILDANDGSYIEGISLFGYAPNPFHPLYATPIVFTPQGHKAYIGSGKVVLESGTISVIDTESRDVIENIWPDLGHFISDLKIGPKIK